jgi:photosystem II stability/assembly factor-like uncharacterized protein
MHLGKLCGVVGFAVLLLFASTAAAQWQNVAPNLLGGFSGRTSAEAAMIFKDGTLWIGRTTLWMSQDTGTTWKQSFTGFSGNIRDIAAFDKNICAFCTSDGMAYITRDGGTTWKLLGSFGGGRPLGSISFFDRAQDIITISIAGTANLTHDGGLTWSSRSISNETLDSKAMGGGSMYITAQNPGFVKAGSINFTTDYGETWTKTAGTFDHDSYSFDVGTCNPDNILVINEDYLDPTDQWSSIFRSTDKGATWQNLEPRLRTGDFFCGSITSSRLAHFVQTNQSGVLRSTDEGLSWTTIGGPSGDFDTRLVTAINSNILIAVDRTDGSIYRTFNSGGDSLLNDGALPEWATISPSILFENDVVSQCDSTVTRTIIIKHQECNALQVNSENITGSAAGDYLLLTRFPVTLTGLDSIKIQFDPTTAGRRNAVYELTLSDGRKFRVDLAGTGSGMDTVRYNPDKLLDFDSLYICDQARLQTIYISYIGCNSRKKLSESIQGNQDFIIVTGAKDSIGSNDFVRISFKPTSSGLKEAIYVLILSNGDTFRLPLTGFGKASDNVDILTSNQKLDTLGVDVRVPITIRGLDKPCVVELVVHYDTCLDYLGSYTLGGTRLDINGQQYRGRSKIRIDASQLSLTGVSANAVFSVVADSFITPHVWFDSLTVYGGASPCSYETLPAISEIALPPGCHVPMVSKFFFHGTPPTLTIKPNPTPGSFSVLSDKSLGEAEFQLFDQVGKAVFKKDVSILKDQPVFFDLHLQPNGYYRLVIATPYGTWSEPIMIQK